MSIFPRAPKDANGEPIDPDKMYVAITSFAGDGLPEVVRAGERRRGSSDAVRKFGWYFASAELPTDEIRAIAQRSFADALAEVHAAQAAEAERKRRSAPRRAADVHRHELKM